MRTGLFTTKDMALISLFAALTAMLSQIVVPLPFTPVPINLATLSVFIAGGLLRPGAAAASQAVYLLLGVAGVPVFAGFSGGVGVLTGPTGGYIAGYILAAFVIGSLKRGLPKYTGAYVVYMIIGALCIFVPGTLWYMLLTKSGLAAALSLCVLPFLPGDCMKICLAAVLVRRLEIVGSYQV